MATILLCGVELFIRGKLEALLPEHRFQTSEGVERPDLVIADIARIDAADVAESYPEVPILGFTNHTDTAGLRRAHAAGFDQVVAKSALFERTNTVDQIPERPGEGVGNEEHEARAQHYRHHAHADNEPVHPFHEESGAVVRLQHHQLDFARTRREIPRSRDARARVLPS